VKTIEEQQQLDPAATGRNNSGTNRNKGSAMFKNSLKQGSRLERETPPGSFPSVVSPPVHPYTGRLACGSVPPAAHDHGFFCTGCKVTTRASAPAVQPSELDSRNASLLPFFFIQLLVFRIARYLC
jgi:hypothetical protein